MKGKSLDIPYAGCRKDKILSARPVINENNFRMFVYYIKERSKVHIKKDLMGEDAPWTEDPIIGSVRFTNVRREHDKQTKYLIEKVCQSNTSYEMKIASIILFRMLNKKESCDGLLPCEFYYPAYKQISKNWINTLPKEHKPFNRAFMVSGMMGSINAIIGKKNSQVESCYEYAYYLWLNGVPQELSKLTKAEDMYNMLNSIPGFGSFLAYQMWVDMTYCPECPVSENEFVVAGPGCKEGIKLLFDKRDGMTPEECLFWLRDNWYELLFEYDIYWNGDEMFPDVPNRERYMNVMSLENCCCEISKYYRAWNGGFVKQKYVGG
jgi:hypothetical protein